MGYEKKYERHIPLCLECGNRIRYGRTDKKFCCDECKSKHHNDIARAARAFRLKTIKAMDKNYGILNEILRGGEDSADLIELVGRGFVPGIVTSYRKSGKHDEYACYDIKFIMTRTRIFSIMKIHNLSVPL